VTSPAPTSAARDLIGRLGPQVVCVAVVPFVLSTVAMRAAGLDATAIVTLAWTVGASAWHRVRTGAVPGLFLLRLVTDGLKLAATVATGSAAVFFLQPSAATMGVALACVASVLVGRPLGARLARDFLPASALAGRTDGPVFAHITLWWAATRAASAVVGALVFTHAPLETFLVLRPVIGWSATGLGAAGVAWLWARSRTPAPVVLLPRPGDPAPALALVAA
jgi:hypothetical protein